MVRFRALTSNTHRSGILLACVTAVISGFAVFLNGYAVRAWKEISDATTYTTMKNLVAAGVLLTVATVASRRSTRRGSRPSGPASWAGLGFVAVFGGAIAFVLFFEGLARATSVSGAFIHKTLVVWVAILAVGILRERIRTFHLIAVGLLVAGQALLAGGIAGIRFGSGETMILVATIIWAAEVIVAKRLLAGLSPIAVGTTRMAGGAAALIGYAVFTGALGDMSALTIRHAGWALLTGLVLAGYVGSWFSALSRAPALDVTAVLVGGALITALLRTAVAGGPLPSLPGLGLVGAGAALAAAAAWRRRPDPATS